MNAPHRAAVAAPQSNISPFPPIRRMLLRTLQVNLGYRCNQACDHCHVGAGPKRAEQMSPATLATVTDFIAAHELTTLDITGGAPELHPHFRHLVTTARARGLEVIDRCNLTILLEPGQETLVTFLAANGVHIIASLPCYSKMRVDQQRGNGVFAKSIEALRRLNEHGYGDVESGLSLDLVHNPIGAQLPAAQADLQADYKRELAQCYGVNFNQLLTLTNMPINRFRHALERDGELETYMRLLMRSYEAENLARLMCLDTVSVDWRGRVYDCDFNQMLGLGLGGTHRAMRLKDLSADMLTDRAIGVGDHCYGCTAGQGSSCGGALSG